MHQIRQKEYRPLQWGQPVELYSAFESPVTESTLSVTSSLKHASSGNLKLKQNIACMIETSLAREARWVEVNWMIACMQAKFRKYWCHEKLSPDAGLYLVRRNVSYPMKYWISYPSIQGSLCLLQNTKQFIRSLGCYVERRSIRVNN